MKNIKKFISLMSICTMIFISLPITISAQEQKRETNLLFVPQTEIQNNAKSVRSANGIPITVTAKQDGTGVDVYVGNIGADGLDSVTVTVSATGYSVPKSQKSYVPALIGKTFSFNFPMIKCNTTYNATINIIDGSGTVTKTGKATLIYSDSTLQNAGWHKGTFSSRAASLEYHFNKHGSEVNAKNIVLYLNKASNYRSEIISDIAQNNTSKYTITTGAGSIASKKYKNKTDSRFAILTNIGNEILSFGK